MELLYRRGNLEDLELLVQLRGEAIRDMNRLDETADLSPLEQNSRSYYQQAIADGSYITYLAMDGERAAGVGGVCLFQVSPSSANLTGRTAFLINIYTRPAYRRQGIGMEILDRLVQAAREAGAGLVTLEATAAGRPLYEKYGFRYLEGDMGLKL